MEPGGSFASMYVQDSWSHGITPVFSYYMMLQSKPGGGDEQHADLANMRNASTMAAYWRDVELLFARIHGAKPVVVHVEPDLWGYLQQAGQAALARGFAQKWVQLRNRLAPNVILAYHMSGWGTNHDIVYERPPDATVRAYAASSAAFYRSLRAHFDISFEDFSDRDAGFYEKIQGNAKTWFTPADFRRHLLYAQTFMRCDRAADGRVADPAREHADASDEQHLESLPGQPRAVDPRLARAPARLRRGAGSRASCSGAAPTVRRARATRRRTASRIRRRSAATRATR